MGERAERRDAWPAPEPVEVEMIFEAGEREPSQGQASARLGRHGPNRLQETPSPSALSVSVARIRSPLIYILLLDASVAQNAVAQKGRR
jgi:hypothetical protein